MSSVITGAKAIFDIDGTPIAHASSCSYSWKHDVFPLETIDVPEIVEHSEIGMTINFTCVTFRIYKQSATSLGLMPKLSFLLRQPELRVTIKDKTTNNVLLIISGIKLIERNGSINARGVWEETLIFAGKKVIDEYENETSKSNSNISSPVVGSKMSNAISSITSR